MKHMRPSAEENSRNTGGRIVAVDVLRLFFALSVVALHINLQAVLPELLSPIYEVVTTVAVPFFFVSSGYFIASKKCGGGTDSNIISLGALSKSIKKYVIMYVKWNAIYFPIVCYGYLYNQSSPLHSFLSYIRGFFINGKHFYSQHLWYILSTIYALVLLYCICRMIKKERLQLIVFGICGFALWCIYLILNYLATESSGFIYRLVMLLFQGNARVLSGAFCICLGMLIYRHKKIFLQQPWMKVGTLLCLLILVVGFLSQDNAFVSSLFAVLLGCCIFVVVLEFGKESAATPQIIALGKLSSYVYLTHLIFCFIFEYILDCTGCMLALTTYSSTIVVSVCIISIQACYRKKIRSEMV